MRRAFRPQSRLSSLRRRAARASLLLCLTVAACAEPPAPDPLTALIDSLTVEQRAAQLLVVDVTGRAGGLPPGQRSWLAAHGAGGLRLRAGDAAATRALRDSAEALSPGPPLLVMAELDAARPGVAGLDDFPPLAAVAHRAGERELRLLGGEVAAAARRAGIDMGIVRLATLDTTAAALLAQDAGTLRRATVAFLQGLDGGGLRVAAEVYGGQGRRGWDRARLDAVERPYAQAVQQGAAALLTGSAVLPALTGDTLPLALSPAGTMGVLRRDLGWEGLVLADVALGGAAGPGTGEAAVLAVLAGADLLVGVAAPDSAVAALAAAVRAGRIPEPLLRQRVRRVLEFRTALPGPPAPAAPPEAPERSELVEALARESWAWAGSPLPAAALGEGAWTVTALGRGDRFAQALAALAPGTRHLRLNLSADSARLVQTLREEAGGARTLVVLEAPDGGERLRRLAAAAFPPADTAAAGPMLYGVRLLGHPPTATDLGGRALVVWGAGALAQETAARVLAGERAREQEPYWAVPPARTLRPVAPESVGFSAARLAAVDAALQRGIETGVFPGAALAVGRRGGLVRLRGYGRVAAEPGAPEVSATESLFDLASLTKVAATTAAAMRLAGEGRLDVDAPVQRYVPEFRGAGKDAVTVRHLLTHTSGLPAGAWLFGSAASPQQALRQVLNARLRQPPGRRVVYSDFGFILLGEVLARAAEEPLDAFLAARVYAPLGMASTHFLPPLSWREASVPTAPPAERRYRIRGEVHDGNAFRLGGVAGHAGLFSTAADMAVFAQTMLNGGWYGTARVFEPEVVRRFVARQRNTDTRALGWDTPGPQSAAGRFVSAETYGHLGFTGTSLWIDPERDLFVVLLTNRTLPGAGSPQMQAVRREVHEAVLQAIADVPIRPRPGARPPPRTARRR